MTTQVELQTPIDGALWLAHRQFAVFPIDHPELTQCSGIGRGHDPATCDQRGKHPSVPFTKTWTRDPEEVARLFSGQPQNVGVSVGQCRGPAGEQLLVMDSDRQGALEDAAQALGHEHVPTMRVHTGKGHHDYYWAPADAKIGNRLGALEGRFDGDVRSGNAFVVGPGSLHATGVVYTLEDPEEYPGQAPEWLLTALLAKPEPARAQVAVPSPRGPVAADVQARVQQLCDEIACAPEGSGNNTVARIAHMIGRYVAAGQLTEDQALNEIHQALASWSSCNRGVYATAERQLREGVAAGPRPWEPKREPRSWPEPPDHWRQEPEPEPQAQDRADLEDTPEPAETAASRLLLPEEFWASRKVLQHIRQAAHARNRSGDIVLAGVLARLAAMLPPEIKADTGVGGPASMNLYVILLGASGTGKSSAAWIPAHLLLPPPRVEFMDGLPLGSGEGLAEAYMGDQVIESEETYKTGPRKGEPKVKIVRGQVRHRALFYADEGESLTKQMFGRNGTTVGESLRRAWSGGTLGQFNGKEVNSRVVEAGSYSLGLVVGFQPETAVPLLEDFAAGTPQRFLWFHTLDPSIPEHLLTDPGPLHLPLIRNGFGHKPKITFDREILHQIRAEDRLRVMGEITPAPLDSQKPVTLVKVAVLLAILESRLHVGMTDWQLAHTVWETSCHVRDWVMAYGSRQRAEEHEQKTAAYVDRELRTHRAKSTADTKVKRIAKNIARHAHGGRAKTVGEARVRIALRDRDLFGTALEYAEGEGWIEVAGDKITPGDSAPAAQ